MELELWQLELKYAALRIGAAGHRARLVAALSEHGQQQPVLVVAGGAGDRYVLIDGYARVAALAEMKRDTVKATVLALSEAEALVLAFRLERNRVRVWEEVQKLGIAISYPALTAFLRRQGVGVKHKQPAGRYHFEPGEEMQHDTSPT